MARNAENGDRACYVQRGGDGPKKDLNLRVGGRTGQGGLGRRGCRDPKLQFKVLTGRGHA